MPRSSPRTYMGEAGKILQKYAAENGNLAVWRCQMPRPYGLRGQQVDMILVGMADENTPDEPTDLIVLRTYMDGLGDGVTIEFLNGDDSETHHTPFGGGWIPIEELEKLARRLPAL